MSRKLPDFAPEGIYHIYNRGIEKRNIFLDSSDYLRFIHCLFEFNDIKPAPSNFHRNNLDGKPGADVRGLTSNKREMLVEILAFCLMPNHFHLLLKEIAEGGTTQFMRKLGTGYVMYFNKKRSRVGGLFQGSFKAVAVDNDEQLIHLSRYIHLNPVNNIDKSWDWGKINKENWLNITKKLAQYRWSSYLDYIGKDNFPSVISKKELEEYFDSNNGYTKFVEEYATEKYEEILAVTID